MDTLTAVPRAHIIEMKIMLNNIIKNDLEECEKLVSSLKSTDHCFFVSCVVAEHLDHKTNPFRCSFHRTRKQLRQGILELYESVEDIRADEKADKITDNLFSDFERHRPKERQRLLIYSRRRPAPHHGSGYSIMGLMIGVDLWHNPSIWPLNPISW